MKRFSVVSGAVLLLALAMVSGEAQAVPINQCIRLVKNNVGAETLVNACNVCYRVKVERQRPGGSGGAPTMRDYTLPPGSQQPLSFKGPGVSRVVAQFPCKG